MPRLRSNRFAQSRSRPNRAWAGVSDTGNNIAGSTKVLLGSIALSNSNIDETVLRFVGDMWVRSDQVVATEQQIGAFGMIVVSDAAVAAGAASIPGPIADIGDDGWFVFVPFVQQFVFADATGFVPNGDTRYHFDFKSKRIVQEGEKIALMFENIAGQGLSVSIIARLLSMVTGTGGR